MTYYIIYTTYCILYTIGALGDAGLHRGGDGANHDMICLVYCSIISYYTIVYYILMYYIELYYSIVRYSILHHYIILC